MKVIKKDSKYYAGGKMKKYKTGGKMTNTEDTYVPRIEALKAKIREEKDPVKKASMLEELKRLRLLSKKDRANVQSDTFKEKRAKKADAVGDKGRGIRIRSSKNTQGVGETGR